MRRALFVLLCLAGCGGTRATAAECRQIFDRIVELELRESGFNDPVLIGRRQNELAQKLAVELDECIGRRLKQGALACTQTAPTAEAISHRCLR